MTRMNEDLTKSMIQYSDEGCLVVQDDLIHFANPRAAELLNISPDEILHTSFSRCIQQGNTGTSPTWEQDQPGECINITKTEIRRNGEQGKEQTFHLKEIAISWNDRPAHLYLLTDITREKVREHNLDAIVDCFTHFSHDPGINIRALTDLAGRLLSGDCALYNRLDQGMLCSIGMWQTPPGFNPCDDPKGHICYDVIQTGSPDMVYIPDLPNTPYFSSDCNVSQYGLKTYIGKAIRIGSKYHGSLCVVYGRHVVPSTESEKYLSLISAALSMEEERRQYIEQANTFARITSHDLKTPVRGIVSLAEWLKEDNAEKINAEGLRNIDIIIGRALRMQNLIEGILLYLDAGRLVEMPKPVDLKTVIEEVIRSLHLPDTYKVIIPEYLPDIFTEEAIIKQIFYKLIDNAVRYINRPDGVIEILASQQGNLMKFGVKDNGPGIDPKYHEKIFEMFQTLRKKDDSDSTGIGLSVVKKNVEEIGGRIWVESEMGSGSSFLFTIPVFPSDIKRTRSKFS